MRNIVRRQDFEMALDGVNRQFVAEPGRNAGRNAPKQYSVTRKYRRRIAKARAKRARAVRP